MRTFIALLIVVLAASVARAEDGVAQAQQALKDQGFYYGEVTGKKDTDTSDAVRRFQIRYGLQVNGELNEETIKALSHPPAAAQVKPQATPIPVPANSPMEENTADLRADPPPAPVVPGNAAPPQPFAMNPPNQPTAPSPPTGRPVLGQAGLFAGTPYEKAPPEVQRRVVLDAQKTLGRRGFYRGAVDGYDSDELEFSIRALQSGLHLPVTGRLDTATLGNLYLLPGSRPPSPYVDPRRRLPPGLEEPPVRGEWVRP